MHQGLEDAIDAGLRDMGLLVGVFDRDRSVHILQQFDDIERF
jgi:hypothetical protein